MDAWTIVQKNGKREYYKNGIRVHVEGPLSFKSVLRYDLGYAVIYEPAPLFNPDVIRIPV